MSRKLKPSVITQLRKLFPEGYWEWSQDWNRWVQYSCDPKKATGPVAVLREVTGYAQLIDTPAGDDKWMPYYADEAGERIPILDCRTYSL